MLLSSPLAPTPQYSPCAADSGSKSALLLFSLKITQKGNNWAVLTSPLGVFRVMYSGLHGGRDPVHFWWDLVLDSEFIRVSQGWGAHPVPMCCLPGCSVPAQWSVFSAWVGRGERQSGGVFFLLHLSFFFFFPFFLSFFSLPLCGLSVGATDRESLSNGLRAGAVFNHRVPESLALGLLGTRAYSENRQLQLRVKAQEPGWVFGIGRRAKKKSWGRRGGKGKGGGKCALWFFSRLATEGCVSEHRFPGAGRGGRMGGAERCLRGAH